MAKTPRSKSSKKSLDEVHVNAAGLDVGTTFHVAAVPSDRDDQPVRTFRSFTADLHQLADWFKSVGVTTIAMESTGVYWVPVSTRSGSSSFTSTASCEAASVLATRWARRSGW